MVTFVIDKFCLALRSLQCFTKYQGNNLGNNRLPERLPLLQLLPRRLVNVLQLVSTLLHQVLGRLLSNSHKCTVTCRVPIGCHTRNGSFLRQPISGRPGQAMAGGYTYAVSYLIASY